MTKNQIRNFKKKAPPKKSPKKQTKAFISQVENIKNQRSIKSVVWDNEKQAQRNV